jgi:hypothetical protein
MPPEPGAPTVARLIHEELCVALDLPVGWELDYDEDKDRLDAVGSDTAYCVGDFCPSITVQRVSFTGDEADFARLAQESLETASSHYAGFELLWSQEAASGRAARCYSFRPGGGDETVLQLQGLVAPDNDAAVFLLNCTAPKLTFPHLDQVFRHAIDSFVSLGPDYVAPEDD